MQGCGSRRHAPRTSGTRSPGRAEPWGRSSHPVAELLDGLRELGAALSIDDFRTGYSSLAHLEELPVVEVKLDRGFVADTARLGHELGVRIVGEGVEDLATLEVLREMGCGTTQGFPHAEPLSAAAFRDRLTARLAGVGSAP